MAGGFRGRVYPTNIRDLGKLHRDRNMLSRAKHLRIRKKIRKLANFKNVKISKLLSYIRALAEKIKEENNEEVKKDLMFNLNYAMRVLKGKRSELSGFVRHLDETVRLAREYMAHYEMINGFTEEQKEEIKKIISFLEGELAVLEPLGNFVLYKEKNREVKAYDYYVELKQIRDNLKKKSDNSFNVETISDEPPPLPDEMKALPSGSESALVRKGKGELAVPGSRALAESGSDSSDTVKARVIPPEALPPGGSSKALVRRGRGELAIRSRGELALVGERALAERDRLMGYIIDYIRELPKSKGYLDFLEWLRNEADQERYILFLQNLRQLLGLNQRDFVFIFEKIERVVRESGNINDALQEINQKLDRIINILEKNSSGISNLREMIEALFGEVRENRDLLNAISREIEKINNILRDNTADQVRTSQEILRIGNLIALIERMRVYDGKTDLIQNFEEADAFYRYFVENVENVPKKLRKIFENWSSYTVVGSESEGERNEKIIALNNFFKENEGRDYLKNIIAQSPIEDIERLKSAIIERIDLLQRNLLETINTNKIELNNRINDVLDALDILYRELGGDIKRFIGERIRSLRQSISEHYRTLPKRVKEALEGSLSELEAKLNNIEFMQEAGIEFFANSLRYLHESIEQIRNLFNSMRANISEDVERIIEKHLGIFLSAISEKADGEELYRYYNDLKATLDEIKAENKRRFDRIDRSLGDLHRAIREIRSDSENASKKISDVSDALFFFEYFRYYDGNEDLIRSPKQLEFLEHILEGRNDYPRALLDALLEPEDSTRINEVNAFFKTSDGKEYLAILRRDLGSEIDSLKTEFLRALNDLKNSLKDKMDRNSEAIKNHIDNVIRVLEANILAKIADLESKIGSLPEKVKEQLEGELSEIKNRLNNIPDASNIDAKFNEIARRLDEIESKISEEADRTRKDVRLHGRATRRLIRALFARLPEEIRKALEPDFENIVRLIGDNKALLESLKEKVSNVSKYFTFEALSRKYAYRISKKSSYIIKDPVEALEFKIYWQKARSKFRPIDMYFIEKIDLALSDYSSHGNIDILNGDLSRIFSDNPEEVSKLLEYSGVSAEQLRRVERNLRDAIDAHFERLLSGNSLLDIHSWYDEIKNYRGGEIFKNPEEVRNFLSALDKYNIGLPYEFVRIWAENENDMPSMREKLNKYFEDDHNRDDFIKHLNRAFSIGKVPDLDALKEELISSISNIRDEIISRVPEEVKEKLKIYVASITNAIADVHEDIRGIQDMLTDFKNRLNDIFTRLETIDNTTSDTNTRVQQIEELLEELKQGQQEIKDRLAGTPPDPGVGGGGAVPDPGADPGATPGADPDAAPDTTPDDKDKKSDDDDKKDKKKDKEKKGWLDEAKSSVAKKSGLAVLLIILGGIYLIGKTISGSTRTVVKTASVPVMPVQSSAIHKASSGLGSIMPSGFTTPLLIILVLITLFLLFPKNK